uniref:Uncharacterized protein n=1 Tax=Fagus sylvatica TaxID=28930 RepID=A0A2N9GNH8_FAGSY
MSDFNVLGTVGKLALPSFCKVPGFRGKSELRTERYGPANRGPVGVFLVRLEGIFPMRIPARPGKVLAIREFHTVHECVFFPNVPGLAESTCCESGRLCAQAWQRRWRGYKKLSAQPYFVGPVFTRVVDVAPDVGFRRSWCRRKACATYFLKGLFSDRDSGLTGGALDDPEVARCS